MERFVAPLNKSTTFSSTLLNKTDVLIYYDNKNWKGITTQIVHNKMSLKVYVNF